MLKPPFSATPKVCSLPIYLLPPNRIKVMSSNAASYARACAHDESSRERKECAALNGFNYVICLFSASPSREVSVCVLPRQTRSFLLFSRAPRGLAIVGPAGN